MYFMCGYYSTLLARRQLDALFSATKTQKYADHDMQERERQRVFWYSSLFLCGWPADWPRCWLINTSVKDALHQDD